LKSKYGFGKQGQQHLATTVLSFVPLFLCYSKLFVYKNELHCDKVYGLKEMVLGELQSLIVAQAVFNSPDCRGA